MGYVTLGVGGMTSYLYQGEFIGSLGCAIAHQRQQQQHVVLQKSQMNALDTVGRQSIVGKIK